MKKVIIARYGEIYLKGDNRKYFEIALEKNIKAKLKNLAKVKMISGRYLIYDYNEDVENEIIRLLKMVFGLVSMSTAIEIETDKQNIIDVCAQIDINGTFKVETTRADKLFAIKSTEFSALIGGVILQHCKNAKVDVHNPQTTIIIDIRENGKTYITNNKVAGAGGMPVGTSGKGLLLLSGGIDSPVAGYQMAKRGLNIDAIYFHSFPYTSEQAKQKVVNLAEVLTNYTGHMKLHVVNFTKIQEEINSCCSPEYIITIMRRFMMRIAEAIAIKNECSCLITGENLAQVASQTVQGITCSNSALTTLPMFRPLISFDKSEISTIARKIGTFEISKLPYEDCCTVFVPRHPVIKPKVKNAIFQENKIASADLLIEWAINNTEVIEL